MSANLFTQTPIEGALWTFAVALQERLAVDLFQTVLFRGMVSVFMGYVVAKALVRFGTGVHNPWLPMFTKLFCCLAGLTLLNSTSSESFRPTSDSGRDWATLASAKPGGVQRFAGLGNEARGLRYYRMAHDTLNALSTRVSALVAQVFGDINSSASPHLLFQTLRETARHTLDDPELIATANQLMESCQRKSHFVASLAMVSYSDQFDLQRENCRNLHDRWRTQLEQWARGRVDSPGSHLTVLAEAARNNSLTRSLGLGDDRVLRNKIIASAVQDYVQNRAGLTNNNTSAQALLDGTDSMLGTSTWVRLSRVLSLGGAMNLLVRPFTGTDYEAADARNDVAALYTKVSVFLPALRGFAKAILALSFLLACVRMCFGSAALLVSWGWCLLLFSAYEPLSTLLYQATVHLTQSPDTLASLEALRDDPLVLVGAQIVDAYASKVQASYFVLQLGLTALTAVGGLSVFRYQRALGGALAGALASKGMGAARSVSLIAGGPAARAAAAAGSVASRMSTPGETRGGERLG